VPRDTVAAPGVALRLSPYTRVGRSAGL
jgi:hypothetical protein